MNVYVARHAETNYNVLGLCNDSPNVEVHLTEHGVEQAGKLAESLASISFDLVITSEFPRTKETAAIVNTRNVLTKEDSRINDVISGFEGQPVSKFREARRSAENRWTIRLNGGESFEDEKRRVKEFLQDLSKRAESNVLIITHQAIARIIYALVNNVPNENIDEIEVSNAYYYSFEL